MRLDFGSGVIREGPGQFDPVSFLENEGQIGPDTLRQVYAVCKILARGQDQPLLGQVARIQVEQPPAVPRPFLLQDVGGQFYFGQAVQGQGRAKDRMRRVMGVPSSGRNSWSG
jgi:hypothetical protein